MLLLRQVNLPLETLRCSNNLATKRAEPEGIEEAALANLAGVGDAFSGPGLWSFIEEDDLCTVDNVGLNRGDVQVLLNLRDPYHIMVRRPPYLDNAVVLVVREADGTESAVHTIQTIHIAFTLVRVGMKLAVKKESLLQDWLQPWRPPVVFLIRTTSSHDSPVLGLDFPDRRFLIVDRQFEERGKCSGFSENGDSG